MIVELFLMFSAFICGMIWAWIIWGDRNKFMRFYRKDEKEKELMNELSKTDGIHLDNGDVAIPFQRINEIYNNLTDKDFKEEE